MSVFNGKRVLVTGGTGSFGNVIVPHLLKETVKEVIVFSRDEEKQFDMRNRIKDNRLKFVIGDVRDRETVLESVDADIVYHAAALKIIPAMEEFPLESVKTNLLGTLNVREACLKNNVYLALFISTDKAVKPVNVYGMCKALAEKIWISPHKGSVLLSAIRYGNVVGSRGSVVPFFLELIRHNRPLPITHPSMTRFWLTLEQAIRLVFTATEQTKGGEIFIPKCPASKITDLATAIAGKDYPIEITGIRPGEKIHETLINEEEMRRIERKRGHFVVKPYGTVHREEDYLNEYTSATAKQLNVEQLRSLLRESGFIK